MGGIDKLLDFLLSIHSMRDTKKGLIKASGQGYYDGSNLYTIGITYSNGTMRILLL